MSNVILNNTSGQIDFTLRESYSRLICGFVGPSGNNSAGFTIQDGAKNTGIFIGNSCIQIYKNTLDFKENANINMLLPSNNCFSISGNGSCFVFNQEGSVSFGSGINSNYKGIQSYSTNPSLTLINSNENCNQAIRFLNSQAVEVFNICQISGLGTRFSGRCLELLTCSGPSICLSGDYTSFNAPINSNFNHFFNGSNYLSGDSCFQGNITGSGVFCYFNSNQECTGFEVNTKSFFKGNSVISGSLCITGFESSINSQNFICSPTGYFSYLSGNCNIFASSIVNQLRVVGCSFLSGGGFFSGENFYNITNINSTGIISERITGSCLRVNCSSVISGCFLSGEIFQNIHLRSCRLELCATGSLGIGICGNISLTGNMNASGYSGIFNGICSLSTNPNFINGSLFTTGSVFIGTDALPSYLCSQFITGCTIGASVTMSGFSGVFQNFCQTLKDESVCFCSCLLNIGLGQTGTVKSINTSKAWGILSISAGSPNFCCGYNLRSAQIYAQGPAAACLIYAHGICFCEPIKYPFVVNFNVYGLSSAITGASASNTSFGCSPTMPLCFSGVSCTACTIVAGGSATSPVRIQLYTSHGRCSSTCCIAPFTFGSSYSEIYFNLQNSKGATTPYSELTRTNANAIIHFNVLGY